MSRQNDIVDIQDWNYRYIYIYIYNPVADIHDDKPQHE